jgi:hypothetical protein
MSSQADVGGSGIPNSTTGENSGEAGAASTAPSATTGSRDAGDASAGPSATTGSRDAGDASAAEASPTATSTSTSPSPMTGSRDAAFAEDGAATEDGAGVASTPTPPSVPAVYFATDVYPILLANCGMTCHASGDSTNGNFTLGTSFPTINVYEELTTLTADKAAPDTACDEVYVMNQDPAASLLYQKISGVGIPAGCGVQMPKGGPYLSAADQETIKNWILGDEIWSR